MATETIFLLKTNDGVIDEMTAHRTRDAAMAALHSYVVQGWDVERLGLEPDDRDEAISSYFARMSGETYDLIELELDD